ncbi:MAG: tetratricopeptide repeat protein [Deltaproteobacteria bacterium]|nr:tetratricopeptide repeat protein [Deltaproteobacteria bacterium]
MRTPFRTAARPLLLALFLLLQPGCDFLAGLGARGPAAGAAAEREGVRLFQARRFEEAIPHLEKALAATTDRDGQVNLLAAIGNCHNELDRYDEALGFYRRALALDPESATVLTNIGVAYRLKGDYDEAERNYLAALALEPDYAELHASLGALAVFREDYDKAIRHLERAAKLDDGLPVVHSNLAIAYASVERFEDAERALKRATVRGYHQPEVIKERIEALRALSREPARRIDPAALRP